ncbi:hypothetical protein BLA14095_02765 [Burkholderia lata]|nr:hypothetical protein BLA14095_02765 [Burkholderia lata]
MLRSEQVRFVASAGTVPDYDGERLVHRTEYGPFTGHRGDEPTERIPPRR